MPMTEPFAELAREIEELYTGIAFLPIQKAVKRALTPRLEQAAREIEKMDEACEGISYQQALEILKGVVGK